MSIDSFINSSMVADIDSFPEYSDAYTSVKGLVKNILEDIDGYDVNADGYVYVLECEFMLYNHTYYYIGAVYKGQLYGRIANHATGCSFEAPVRQERTTVLGNVSNHIDSYIVTDIESVDSYYNEGLEFDTFKKLIRNEERKKSYRIAIEKDTTNVIGGK